MYWLISKINPFVSKLTKIPFTSKIDFNEIDITQNTSNNKTQIPMQISNSFYKEQYLSKSLQRGSSMFNIEGQLLQLESKANLDIDEINRETFESQNEDKRKRFIRCIITLLDIIGVLFIISSFVLALIESESFYTLNKPFLLVGKILIISIHQNQESKPWNDIFKYYNLTNAMSDGLIYSERSIEYDNSDFFQLYGISEKKYKYYNGKKSFDDIVIPIQTSDKVNNLSIALGVVSILSIVCAFTSYYCCYLYKKYYYLNLPFYKTELFLYSFNEFIGSFFIPYPKLKSYSIYCSHDDCVIYPNSIFLSIIVFFRLFFIIKLVKFSYWNKAPLIIRCNKFGIRHTLGFAMKSYFHYHPKKLILFLLFSIILSFGISIRIIERYYWIGLIKNQNWDNVFESLFFVFMTIITIGTCDYYPHSTIGKLLTVILSLIGIQVTASIMIDICDNSSFSFKEEQVNILITRTEIKNQMKHCYSNMIYKYLSLYLSKRKRNKHSIIALKREIKHDYEEIKDFKKQSNFYTFQPIKERCMEIIEDFQSNLKRINSSLAVLQAVNHHMDKFTSKQNTIIKRLQHNVLCLKKFYVLIENCQESFGTLVNYDKKVLLDELGNNYYSIKSSIRNYSNNLSQTDTIEQKRTNTYLQSKESLDGKYLDNILQSHCYEELLRCKNDIKNYQVSADEVQDHFTELFLEPNKNQFAFFNKGHIKWNTSKSVIYPKGKCLTCQ